MTWSLDDVPWTKVFLAAGALLSGAVLTIGTHDGEKSRAPIPVLGEEIPVSQRLDKIESQLRSLADWQAHHEGYSKTESERLRSGIEQALREIAEVRAQLYRRASEPGANFIEGVHP